MNTPEANANLPRVIYFIDNSLYDIDILVAGLPENAIYQVIDSGADGLDQIMTTLEHHGEFDAIHIISHGQPGAIQLGNSLIDRSTLTERSADFEHLGSFISENGDILLYGCNVGEGDEGHAFVHELAQLTNADVAASLDATGPSVLGGNWVLELSTGEIAVDGFLSNEAMEAYSGLLATAPGIFNNQYVKFGYSANGTFGFGGNTKPGIQYDPEGSFGFLDTADYLTPGSPWEMFSVRVGSSTFVNNNTSPTGGQITTTINSAASSIQTSGSGSTAKTFGELVFESTFSSVPGLKMTQVYSLGENERVISIRVTFENTGSSSIFDVRYARAIDPDVDSNGLPGSTTNTLNVRGADGIPETDIVLGTGPVSGRVIGLYSNTSLESNAGVTGWTTDPNTYLNGGDEFRDGATRDDTIGLGINVGNLAAGQSVSFSLAYVFAASAADLQETIEEVPASNQAPILDAYDAVVTQGDEDTEITVTFAHLSGKASDPDGKVDAFKVTEVNSGTLRIGTSPEDAELWAVGSNDQITSAHNAYWTPNQDVNGTSIPAFKVRAVDDEGALSAATRDVPVQVLPVNDRPDLAGTVVEMPKLLEDPTVNNGQTVESLFAPRFTDVDAGDTPNLTGNFAGIVITANSETIIGQWQYTTDGTNWFNVGTVSTEFGLVLAPTAILRFAPNPDAYGIPEPLIVWALDNSYGAGFSSGETRVTFDTVSPAEDGPLSNNSLTVAIEVIPVNDSPVFTSGAPTATITETAANDTSVGEGVTLTAGANSDVIDNQLTGTLTATDVDNDDNTLVFSIRGGGKAESTWSKVGLFGTLTLNEHTGQWSYEATNFNAINALPEGAVVNEVFDFRVTDPEGASSIQQLTITLTGTNDTPILASAIGDQALSGTGDWFYQIPAATFTDAEGMGLTYTVRVTHVNGAEVDYSITDTVTPNADDTAGLASNWLTFDEASRSFSGNPPLSWGNQSLTFEVTASDGSLSATDTFTLNISANENQPPVVDNPLTWAAVNAPKEITSVTFDGMLGGQAIRFDGSGPIVLGSTAGANEVAAAVAAEITASSGLYDVTSSDGANVRLTAKEAGERAEFTNGTVIIDDVGRYTVTIVQEGAEAVAEQVSVQFHEVAGAQTLAFDGQTITINDLNTADIASAVAAQVNGNGEWNAAVHETFADTIIFTARTPGARDSLTAADFNVIVDNSLASPSVITQGGSTLIFEITDAQAANASLFSLTAGDRTVTDLDISSATSGADLAGLINTEFAGTPVSAVWEGNQLIITDAAGGAFGAPELKLEDDVAAMFTDDGTATEAVEVTFANAEGATRIVFDGVEVSLTGTETAAQVAQQFHDAYSAAAEGTQWTSAYIESGTTVQLTAKTPGAVADLTVDDFIVTGDTIAAPANAFVPSLEGQDARFEIVDLTFIDGPYGGAEFSVGDTTVVAGTAVTGEQIAEAINDASLANYTVTERDGATVTLEANQGGEKTDLGTEELVIYSTPISVVSGNTYKPDYAPRQGTFTFSNRTGEPDYLLEFFGRHIDIAGNQTPAQVLAQFVSQLPLIYDGETFKSYHVNSNWSIYVGTGYSNASIGQFLLIENINGSTSTNITATDFIARNEVGAAGTDINVIIQGDSWSYTIPSETFSDPENDALVYSAFTINPANGAATLITDSPALSFSPDTLTLSGNGAVPANLLIEIRAFDAVSNGTAASQFQLIVYNNTQDSDLTVGVMPASVPFVDGPGSGIYTVPARAFNFLGEEDNGLTYSATLADDSALPAWLSFDPDTATFSGNPPAGEENLSVKVTATTTTGTSVFTTFTLAIINPNDPLALVTPLQDQPGVPGGAVSILFDKPFIDPDGSPTGTATTEGISYSATANGQALDSFGLSLIEVTEGENAGKLLLSGTVPGNAAYLNIELTGTESTGGSTATTSFTLNLGGTAEGALPGALLPNNAGAVAITINEGADLGAPKLGDTLTATVSDGDGFNPANVIYQWQIQADDVWTDVAGARGNEQSLTLATTEVGFPVRVQAFYTDNGNVAESPISDALPAIDNINTPGEITIAGTGANAGTNWSAIITDPDGLFTATPTYQWQIADTEGGDFTNIPGAIFSSYTLTSADGGKWIRVITHYTDDFGAEESNITSVPRNVNLSAIAPVANNQEGEAQEEGHEVPGENAIGNLLADEAATDANPGQTETLVISAVRAGNIEGIGRPANDDGDSFIISGNYGDLIVNKTTGEYTYIVAQTNESVDGLNVGQTLTEVFNYTVRDVDGLTDTALLTITINGANDKPTISGQVDSVTVEEDVPTQIPLDVLSIVDPDDNALTLTLSVTSGTLRVDTLDTAVEVAGNDTDTLVLNVTSSPETLMGWLIDNPIYYVTPINAPSGEIAALSYTIDDGTGAIPASGTTTIIATPTNDAPILDAGGSEAAGIHAVGTFKPRGDAVIIAPALELTDIDSPTMGSATISLVSGAQDNQFGVFYESLSLTADGVNAASTAGLTVSSSQTADGAALTISGIASVEDYQAILRQVQYNNANPNAFVGDREITFSVIDAEGDESNTAFITTTDENTDIAVGQRIFINDVDSGAVIALKVDNQNFVASRPLSLESGDSLKFYDAATQPKFAFDLEVNVVLAETDAPITEAVVAGPRVATVTVSVPWTPVIDMNGPLPGRDHDVTYIEKAPAVAVATSNSSIVDQDGLIRNLTLTLTNPLDNTEDLTQEYLSVTQATLDWLAPRGISIDTEASDGEAVSGSGWTKATTITFVASGDGGTSTNFQVALRGVRYQNDSTAPSVETRYVEANAIDVDDNVGVGAQTIINLIAVNDAPVGIDSQVAGTEDVVYPFGVTDFGFSDPWDNDVHELAAVKISTLPEYGVLLLDNVPVNAGDFVSREQLEAGLLTYSPAANINGDAAASFTFQVQDNGGTENGGVDLDPTPRTLTIDLAPVNDAPVLTDALKAAATITEDEVTNAGNLVSALLGTITDVDTGEHGEHNGVKQGMAIFEASNGGDIGGHWEFSLYNAETEEFGEWQAINLTAVGQVLLLDQTDKVRFVPDQIGGTTANDLAEPSLRYYAWDQATGVPGDIVSGIAGEANVANRGDSSAYSLAEGLVTLTVTDVNDAPTIVAPVPQTVDEDGVLTITGLSFDDVDISGRADGDTSNDSVTITLEVAHGTLTLTNTDGITFVGDSANEGASLTFYGTLTDVNAAVAGLEYRPDENFNGTDTLSVKIDDQGNVGGDPLYTETDIAITVNPVNDAPVLTDALKAAATITEDEVTNAGNLVSALLGTITDVDTGEHGEHNGVKQGMAIFEASNGGDIGGHWEFSLYNAETEEFGEWQAINLTAVGQVLLLDQTDKVRFVPDQIGGTTANDLAEPSLRYYAWDQATGVPGDIVSGIAGEANVANRGDSSAYSLAEGLVTLTVTDVNDAPTIVAPVPQTVDEDGVLTITGLSFDDVDISGRADGDTSNDSVTITLEVAHGTLTLTNTDGITFVGDSANEGASLTFYGTLTDVNAAVAGLEYRPDENFNGTDTLSVKIDDQGNVGGDPLYTETDIAITVNPVNDAPVLADALKAAATITEDEVTNAGNLVSALLGTITDVDTGEHGEHNGVKQGMAIFEASNGGDIGGHWEFSLYNAETEAFGEWQAINFTAVGQVLLLDQDDKVRFVPDAKNGTTANDLTEPSLRYYAWDQATGVPGGIVSDIAGEDNAGSRGGSSAYSLAEGLVTLTVTDVNDAPEVSVDNDTKFYARSEGIPLFASDEEVTLSDVDFGDYLTEARLILDSAWTTDNAFGDTWETLFSTSGSSFTTSLDNVLTITGNGTEASPLVITGDGSHEEYTEALLSLRYQNANENAFVGTRNVSLTVKDSEGEPSAPAVFTVDVIWSTVVDLSGPTEETRDHQISYTEGAAPVAIAASDAELIDQDGNTKSVTVTLRDTVNGSNEKLFITESQLPTFYAIGVTVTGNNSHEITLSNESGLDPTFFQLALRAIQYSNTSTRPTDAPRFVDVTTVDMDDNPGVSATTTINVTIVNDPPFGSVTISNTADERDINDVRVGDVLTVTHDVDDPDGGPYEPVTFEWLIDNEVVHTGNSYALTRDDVGKSLSVRIQYTDGEGFFETVVSAPTAEVANVNEAPQAIEPAPSDTASENDPGFSFDLLDGVTDIDVDFGLDSLTIDSVVYVVDGEATGNDGQDLPAGVSRSDSMITVDPSQYKFLNDEEISTIVVTYTVKDEEGETATQTYTITVTGVNDPAVIGGDLTQAADETDAPLTLTGTLTAVDVDNEDNKFQVQENVEGTHGAFSLTEDGVWTFVANSAFDELNVGDTVEESFAVRSIDGTEASVTVTINGTNDPAVIGGDLTQAADETDAPLTLTGTLTASDVDNEDNKFQVQEDVAGTYGTFSLTEDGAWTFVANSAFDYLNVGDTVEESFTVRSIDGTEASVTVTINGTNDPAVIGGDLTQAADETDAPLTLT
ncbi:VCBS domain-containing protein, partial [Alkalicoccus sp. WONF2802]